MPEVFQVSVELGFPYTKGAIHVVGGRNPGRHTVSLQEVRIRGRFGPGFAVLYCRCDTCATEWFSVAPGANEL